VVVVMLLFLSAVLMMVMVGMVVVEVTALTMMTLGWIASNRGWLWRAVIEAPGRLWHALFGTKVMHSSSSYTHAPDL
jgi:hypothetical protein